MSEGKAVKVIVRIRPASKNTPKDTYTDGIPSICLRDVSEADDTVQIFNWRSNNEMLSYKFDKVFNEDSTQEMLYKKCLPFLKYALAGQNATIIAYGPTGAGKTHTILGTNETPGLIPRCINGLLLLIKSHLQKHADWTFNYSFSYLEVYQEKVYDLLEPKEKDLQIRQDATGNIIVSNLAEVPFQTFKEFNSLFTVCSRNRTVAPTKLNSRSSRSHTILLIKVTKSSKVPPFKQLIGKLYLIDLAGSEDNRRTGNTGIRLKESGAINTSLFCLGKVVDALNHGQARIPYRDSKLTRLLQDSIGGSAHSLMIANISPESTFYFDTLNTLKFASKSRKVVNTPFTRENEAIHLATKRPRPTSDNNTCESPTKKHKENEEEETMVEDIEKKAVKEIRDLLNPITERQNQFEIALMERLASLEEKIVKNSASKSESTVVERPRTPPLQNRSNNSSKTRPCVRVKPLFSNNPSVFSKTPLRETTNLPKTANETFLISRKKSRRPVGKDVTFEGKSFVLLDTPSPVRQTENDKVRKPSLPEVIRTGCLEENVTPEEPSGHYSITIDPEVHRQCEIQLLKQINEGSLKDITKQLKGIGKKKADKIIAWRNENGEFQDLADLKSVGFSNKMLETFKKNNLLSRLTIN